jgi:hypothetical protein
MLNFILYKFGENITFECIFYDNLPFFYIFYKSKIIIYINTINFIEYLNELILNKNK